jgi:peptidoglycan/LPS O-acetylase OafA/YrhL
MGQTNFIPRLESLRGVAAVLVAAYHCGVMYLQYPASGTSRLYFAFANGLGCVVVFFVISGFVLARSLDRDASISFASFARNRAFRLLPASIAVVGLLTFLHERFGFYVGFEASFAPLNVLLNMLLIKSDINGVMWSLTVEIAATPLIFMSVRAYRDHGRAPLLAVAAVLFGLSFVGQYRDLIGANLAPLYAFLGGILVHFEGPKIARWVSPRTSIWIPVLGITFFLVAGMLKQDAGLMILLDCIGGALLVLTISQFPHQRMMRPLDWPLVRFYGRISYSFYLLHMLMVAPAIALGARLFEHLNPWTTAITLSMLTILAAGVPALACYKLIEIPGINLGRWLAGFNGLRNRAVAQ